MSWLARSLTNSLRPDLRRGGGSGGDEDGGDAGEGGAVKMGEDRRGEQDPPIDPETRSRGVKEDLSELSKTLSRQFWGVANFLAPPPHNPSSDGSSTSDGDRQSDPAASEGVDLSEVADSPAIVGIRSDFAEIGGRFRSGISRISGHKAVTEISKIASTFLPFGSEEIEESEGRFGGDAVGVTEEVLAFARNISMHPETWLDFPLLADDEDSDDFDMSNVQQEHALAVERLAPRLAALRIELCPTHMSEGCFWKIYFVLLHPRLNKHDAELLSTPQIVEARAMLLQRLQSRAKPAAEKPRVDVSYRKGDDTSVPPKEQFTGSRDIYETTPPRTREGGTSVPFADFETEKHPILTTDTTFIDKSVIEEQPLVQLHKDLSDTSKISIPKFDEEGDDWLEDDSGEMGVPGSSAIPFENDEDVSFSDLEEEDDGNVPASSKTESKTINSAQPKDKAVLVDKSSGGSATDGNSVIRQTNEESNDWPGVDDI
ncbi:uncharacterized protein LOC103707513 isoform X2 [Phoenix dactylifera]|uniref:Uncharacterized protein LOC103707513 isoform X2 n=1 Tax=Phoenix dactylifera TaxID=42345 RepID=A0A8B7C2E5_PHODC|nr:uncharacterized protein LOC103707513 isoform X2 [Phoenix dactylifera]